MGDTYAGLLDAQLRGYIRGQLDATLGPMLEDFRIVLGDTLAKKIDSSADPVADALRYTFEALGADAVARRQVVDVGAVAGAVEESDPRYGAW